MPADNFTQREVVMVRKIIDNERWLESERRGYDVGANDPEVMLNVCAIVLRVGEEMRMEAERAA